MRELIWEYPSGLMGGPRHIRLIRGKLVAIEADSKRLVLNVQDVESSMGVMTGARVYLRIVVASELAVGAFRLKHVALLVFPDDQPPFNDLQLGERGIIGDPSAFGVSKV